MRNLVGLLSLALLASACTTIQVPLPGTHVLRPRAGLSDVGARVSVGAVKTPSVEGTIDEVTDPNDIVINPLPGELDPEGDEVPATTPYAAVELGIDWSKRFELGVSTNRGVFFMWDYALWNNAALTLTPAYNSLSVEGGDPELKEATDENGDPILELDHSYKGKASNFNLTQLGSVWLGNVNWAAIYLYGGVGANFFEASIERKDSEEIEKASQVAPSALVGLHIRLLVFELTMETGGTVIKYRDGSKKTVPTNGGTFSLHIAI